MSVHPLERVLKRRSIVLFANLPADLDHVVRPNAHHVRIECTVVDGTHGNPIRHHRLPSLGILLDVRCVEKLRMAKRAEGATFAVRGENVPAELRLMKSPTDHGQGVLPTTYLVGLGEVNVSLPRSLHAFVHRDDDLVILSLLGHEPHREQRLIESRSDAPEPDERLARFHCLPEGNVVESKWIGLAPLVAWVAVVTYMVVVRAFVHREDRERSRMPRHNSDAPHVLLKREASLAERKPAEVCAMNEAAGSGHDIPEECERCGAEFVVLVDCSHGRIMDRPSIAPQGVRGAASGAMWCGATLPLPMSSENETRDALAREMYWAEEATPRSKMDTAAVRDALHDFALLMRDDEKQVIPRGEPNLASRRRYRRRLKVRLFRLFRPISWRYDRLLGDLGELNAALADRVAELEAEVARLRAKAGDE